MYESYRAGINPFAWNGLPAQNWSASPQGFGSGQDIRFVNGIEEAKNCTVPLGSRVILMDQGRDRFYIKETDLQGVSTVSEYEFKRAEAEAPKEYVTKEELSAFADQMMRQMEERYESIVQAGARSKSSSSKRVAADSV